MLKTFFKQILFVTLLGIHLDLAILTLFSVNRVLDLGIHHGIYAALPDIAVSPNTMVRQESVEVLFPTVIEGRDVLTALENGVKHSVITEPLVDEES